MRWCQVVSLLERSNPAFSEAAVVDVGLAGPHNLDRAARLLREEHRVDNEVDIPVAAPAEAATHQHVVEFDLLARNAEQFRWRFRRGGLALSSGPDLDGIAGRRY